MDGIAAVQQRIASIEARFGAAPAAPAPAAPTPLTPGGMAVATRSAAPAALAGAASPGGFEATFAAALAPAAPSGLTPAARLAPGQYGRLTPPAELTRYGNGRIPTEALTPIGAGSHRLWGPAAEAFTRMRADAEQAGISFGVTDSYRDLAGQERLAAQKGLYSQGGLAAKPGTSNHGWGLAVDLDLNSDAQQWMRDNGWRYGFVEDVPREPWHWTYRPA